MYKTPINYNNTLTLKKSSTSVESTLQIIVSIVIVISYIITYSNKTIIIVICEHIFYNYGCTRIRIHVPYQQPMWVYGNVNT